MPDNNFSLKDIFERCVDEASVKTIIATHNLRDTYGYSRTWNYISNAIRDLSNSGYFPEDFVFTLMDNLRQDLDDDNILNGMIEYDSESHKRCKESMLRSYDVALSLFKKDIDYDESARFILFLSGLRDIRNEFDMSKYYMNKDRLVRFSESDHPSDTFIALHNLYKQSFEDLYKPLSFTLTELFTRYPGMDDHHAYVLSEEMMCLEYCPSYRNEIKSDFREIRNAYSHEDYTESEVLTIKYRNGVEKTYDVKTFLSIISIMQYKCMMIRNMVPMLNLGILMKMRTFF